MLFIVLRRKVWWVLDGNFYSGNSQAFRCSSFLPQVSVVWFLSPQKIFLKAKVCLDLGHSTSNVKHDATGKKDWSLLSCVLILFRFIYFVYLWLFYLHMYHVCAWCQVKSEGNIRSVEPGVMSSCKLLYRSWEPTPGPLQEQHVFFTKPSLY